MIQTVFWPPAPSSTSALLNDAPGGGTGMNGALHAHRTVNAPSSVASFSSRRLGSLRASGVPGIAFMCGIASSGLQEQGARRTAEPRRVRAGGRAAVNSVGSCRNWISAPLTG